MGTIKDLSGNKRNDRLIYMVSINDDITKYVKITPNSEPEYNAEINIYKELNAYMKNDKKIKNKILKICNNDFIDNICNDIELRLYENITCNLTFENSKNVKKLYKTYDNHRKNYKIQYLVTEYNDNYIPIQDDKKYFLTKYNEYPEKIHILLEKLFTTLIYLNKNFGFIHWDLHTGNLLINKKTCTDFLLYDFDMAETNLVKNDTFFERYADEINGSIDIKKIIEQLNIDKTYEEKRKIYGLATDFLTFFFGCKCKLEIDINVDYFTSPLIKKIVKKMNKINYSDNEDMFNTAIPLLCKSIVKYIN